MYEQIVRRIAEAKEEDEVVDNEKGFIDKAVEIVRKYDFNFKGIANGASGQAALVDEYTDFSKELFHLKELTNVRASLTH